MKAPRSVQPESVELSHAFSTFAISHSAIQEFLSGNADLDLTGIRFANPFLKGIRFSVASGLHIIVAHERRHLWQAWKSRRLVEAITSSPAANL